MDRGIKGTHLPKVTRVTTLHSVYETDGAYMWPNGSLTVYPPRQNGAVILSANHWKKAELRADR